ncbi:TetR/AcrR family transcriptional regulator [Streptomyces sp. NPDC058000]|uniref:TetR/AcrR family transcriptional regulator n=1 Tax=Streptomyces sp. NPDC058000 TaxID=3346299 RepID=UPI0036E9C3AD
MTRGTNARAAIAAEALRMFAERGIDAVSLREITAAAGQRNKSAAQYHFGTKEHLVREIFERNAHEVNARRQRLLDALSTRDPRPGVPDLVDALIRPLAETVDEHSHYARFLAQVSLHPWIDALAAADPEVTSSIQAVFTALAQHLDHVPTPILRTRLALGMTLTVHALAACERSLPPADPDNARRTALLTVNLVDSLVGSLTAAVSPAALDLLANGNDAPASGWTWPLLIGAEGGG